MTFMTDGIITALTQDILGKLGNKSESSSPKFKYTVDTVTKAVHRIATLRSIPNNIKIQKGDNLYRALRLDLIQRQRNYSSFEEAFTNLGNRNLYIQGELFTSEMWTTYESKAEDIIEPLVPMTFESLERNYLVAILARLDEADLIAMQLAHKDSRAIIDYVMNSCVELEKNEAPSEYVLAIHKKLAKQIVDRQLKEIKKRTGTQDSLDNIKINLSFEHFVNSDKNDHFGFTEHLKTFINSIPNGDNRNPVCTLEEAYTNYKDCRTSIIDNAKAIVFNFSHSKLTMLPPEIAQLTDLTHLALNNNYLTSFPAELDQLKCLTSLNLSNNYLASLSFELGQLISLRTLNLSGNKLTSLPAELGQLTGLTALHLSRNNLRSLPAELGQLKCLTSLALSNNNLTSLSFELGQLKGLTYLGLSENNLTSLPAELGQLADLAALTLRHNSFTNEVRKELRECFKGLKNLRNQKILL